MSHITKDDGRVVGVSVEGTLTFYEEAVFESGRQLFHESVSVGRDYCKQMISVCASAVPIYLALMKFTGSAASEVQNKCFNDLAATQIVLQLTPAILLLLAVLSFSFGFIPIIQKSGLNTIEDIQNARSKVIGHRHKWGWIGFTFFFLGMALGVLVILYR